ncbi:Tim44 domain-containing protein [Pararobbsia silviterrae]|uniref:Tim44 domain-containing protein n=1 Tax=Pararobbsia silviterrae TaxID=1792498 RepID=A0A494Y2L8_9BURK|nr:Tim44-like domain-containing protein [Pararobbsia silviterrae]RKP55703.1 Tim44 domain-containing protein [Pararobbsia silviterrae]
MPAFVVRLFRRARAGDGKKLAALSAAAVLAISALVPFEVEAKRMGGSRSIGRQTQMAPTPAQSPSAAPASPGQAQRAQQTPPTQQNATPAAGSPAAAQPAAARPGNRWLGPLAGLAAGLGLGALLSHFGLGEGLAQMLSNLMLAGVIVFAAVALFRWIARKRRPDLAYPQGSGTMRQMDSTQGVLDASPRFASATSQSGTNGASAAYDASPALASPSLRRAEPIGSVPPGFDGESFVRTAKVAFVRLQAAWDHADQGDIYAFTTPEMFAEIKMDLEARGKQPNRTDVVELNGHLLGVETHGSEELASVRFEGLMREAEDEAAKPFEEVWNFVRDARRDDTWRLGGIQQIR